MLIGKSDGKKLVDFISTASKEQLDQIAVIADFNLARPDDRVEYDIWYTSASIHALDFISDFMGVDKKFGDTVLMTPHFRFFSVGKNDVD